MGQKTVNHPCSALRYAFKNFIFLLPFALLPACVLAFAADRGGGAFLAALYRGEDLSFAAFFNFLSPFNAHGWPFAAAAFVLAALCLPLLTGFIEKHMRIGIRSLHGLRGRFNYNFLSTLALLTLFVAVYELWAALAAGLLYAETLLLGRASGFAAVVLTFLCLVALLSYLASLAMLWLPSLQITGYAFMDALACANALYAKVRYSLFLGVFLPALAGVAVQFACVLLLPARLELVAAAVRAVLYLVLLLYYAALMFAAYFGASGEARQDEPKKYGSGVGL